VFDRSYPLLFVIYTTGMPQIKTQPYNSYSMGF